MKKSTGVKMIGIIGIVLVAVGLFLAFKSNEDKNMVTVTFKDEEGTLLFVKKVKKGEKVERIEPDKKEGYNFVDWYLDSLVYDFETAVEKDLTLIGKWDESILKGDYYTVTFYNDDDRLHEIHEVEKGGQVPEPYQPESSEGGVFEGWYLDDERFDFSTPITSDIKLKARYTKSENPTVPGNTTAPGTSTTNPSGGKNPSTGGSSSSSPYGPGTSTTPDENNPNFVLPPSPDDPDFVKETGINVPYQSITIRSGEKKSVNASITPSNASIKDMHIYCEDSTICYIDEDLNLVSAGQSGKTNLILETFHGIKKTIPVTVKPTYQGVIHDVYLRILTSDYTFVEGEMTIRYIATGEVKTVHINSGIGTEMEVPEGNAELKDLIEIVSVQVND